MTYTEKDVSTAPGPELVPVTRQPDAGQPEELHEWPIIAGLAADADDPDEAKPLDHPQRLLGELPALGSNDNP
jgi:hypothetical protein